MKDERCFAIVQKGKCAALATESCPGYGRCTFYKPVWVHERDREQANARLRALPEEEQRAIADKYHKGIMPWRGEQE